MYKGKVFSSQSLVFIGIQCICIILCITQCWGQAAISANPPRLYYSLMPGAAGSQKVYLTNPGDKPLEVSVSLGDWNYDSLGNNKLYEQGTLKTSCANWLQIFPGSYFTLAPKGSQELTINATMPKDADTSLSVHTAILYFTQLNPENSPNKKGAAIKISLRMAVKVYINLAIDNSKDIEIENLFDTTIVSPDKKRIRNLCLNFKNTGELWLDGNIKWQILNESTGKEIKIKPTNFFSLPGDNRYQFVPLPENLEKGKYSATAIINYGNNDELKIAQLEFAY